MSAADHRPNWRMFCSGYNIVSKVKALQNSDRLETAEQWHHSADNIAITCCSSKAASKQFMNANDNNNNYS